MLSYSAVSSATLRTQTAPPEAVNCLRCQGEGIIMTCLDTHCIEQNECIHALYEDCPACQKQGWVA